jgi:cation diffusion facilitator CzcD-associated flavoprotein CzcO
MSKARRPMRIAVIGAGASGIMAVIKLRDAGFEDVTVFEKEGDLGGTWRDNRYPGLTCDVESMAYRYSFAPNPDWSKVCSPGPEILSYFRSVATLYQVQQHISFNSEVVRADYDNGRWELETTQGPQGKFDAVITATGVLHHPVLPDLPGLDSFAGAYFHSSRWPKTLDLTGKRVGVIGTGSTAIQIVGAIVSTVGQLSLFQRTAQWVMPLANPYYTEEQKAWFRANPEFLESEYERLNEDQGNKFAAAVVGANPKVYERISQIALDNLNASVRDPDLRAKLTPDHKVGCKRLIMSDAFYEAIQQPNACLVTSGIERVEAGGIRTVDGHGHELDVLVMATGFNTHQFFRPMAVTGRNGVRMEDAWAERNEGYMSVTAAEFPNWFMIGGPNSPIGNFSWLRTAECQFGYALKLIEDLADSGIREIVPRPQAVQAYNQALRDKMPETIWASGCSSWYIDKFGNLAAYPFTYQKFQSDLAAPVMADFERT